MAPPVARKTLKLRSSDNQVFVVDEAFIQESILVKFFYYRSNKTTAREVFLGGCTGAALSTLIKLVNCFKDDPEYIAPIDREKREKPLPDSHPAMKFMKALSADEFKAVADACAYIKARRLVDRLWEAVLKNAELKRFYESIIFG